MKSEVCLLIAASALLVAAASPATASVPTSYCYDGATYDRDGDGYANLGLLDPKAPRFAVEGDCPGTAVTEYGDCNDAEPRVHPRRSEVAYNLADDNCDGTVDEPAFRYSATAEGNSTTWFRAEFNYNNSTVRASSQAGSLYAKVNYARLTNSGSAVDTGYMEVFAADVGHHYARLRVTGVSAGTVYRAKVTFYRREANGSYTQLAATAIRLYTMTDSSTEKVHKRFLMVSKALKEFNDSNMGYVGYRGIVDPDGTRYDARRAEAWCSEFYAWVTQDWLEDIAGLDWTEELGDYFDDYDSFFATVQIPATAAPGDFLQMDTDKKNGVNHSGMFLAYDGTLGEVWSVEGNVGNEVRIMRRAADFEQCPRVYWMFGWIKNAMFQ